MGNTQCEQFNQTLLAILRSTSDNKNIRWKDHVNKITFAYIFTHYNSTGFRHLSSYLGENPEYPLILSSEIPRLEQ